MRALVTGGNGFLGSYLVDALLAAGHEVVCLVRPSSNLQWLKNKPVSLVVGEIAPDHPSWKKALNGVDWFFHLAGVIRTVHLQEYYQVNSYGTKACLEACLQHAPALRRFVLVSSMAVSGPAPVGETRTETMPCQPLDDYGKSKLAGEQIVMRYRDRLPVVALRPPAIYGARDTMTFPLFKLARHGVCFVPSGPERLISMIYVEDVAAACLWAAENPAAAGEVFFVADGAPHTWRTFAAAVSETMGRKVKSVPVPKPLFYGVAQIEEWRAKCLGCSPRLRQGMVRQFFASSWGVSIQKIQKAGFVPRYSLQNGLAKTVAGYRQLGWL